MNKFAKFDRQHVIDKAMELYWEKGFHATSMRALQEAVDMRPGSIYAAFGSKDGLFKEAIISYTQRIIDQLNQCRSSQHSPISALKLFTKQSILVVENGNPSALCMLVKTVSELTTQHSILLDEAKFSLNKIENKFVDLLIESQYLGELDKNKNPTILAAYLQAQIIGFKMYVNICNNKDIVVDFVDDIFNHHPF